MSVPGVTSQKKKKWDPFSETLMNCQLCTFIKGKRHKDTATDPLI